jgi:GT2 family glycosyltransferase
MTTVALAIICHDRPDELADALASAAGEAWEEVVVLDMASEPPLTPVAGVTLLRSDDNVGVTAGRNRLLEAIAADVIVFLDDDAVLTAPAVEPLRRRFDSDEKLAVVAFLVRRKDGTTVSSEYPFRGPAREDPSPRPCAYFVGCGYAARRSAVSSTGGYDESFFYSTEEVDLSLRLLARGWRLLYDPGLTIEHRPSPRGRSVAPRVPALLLRNRVIVARRHLPLAAAVVHLGAWGSRTGLAAARAGGIRQWLRAWQEGLRAPVDRRPLAWRDAVRIHRLGGRVLW